MELKSKDSGQGAHRGENPSQRMQDIAPRGTRRGTRWSPRSPRRSLETQRDLQSPARPERPRNGDETTGGVCAKSSSRRPTTQDVLLEETSHRRPASRLPLSQRRLRYNGGPRRGKTEHPGDPLLDQTTTARLEVLSLLLQGLMAGSALTTTVPMAIVASQWGYRARVCPLFVEVPPGFSIKWGNEDLTPCKVTAYLPILGLLLSCTMLLFHLGSLRAWRRQGDHRLLAFSRLYTLVALAIAVVEALIFVCVSLTLTEGFRQTCIAFDLNLSWNDVDYSCRKHYDDRDEAYGLHDVNTFAMILTALVGSWVGAVSAILLAIIYMLRARICWCQLLCL